MQVTYREPVTDAERALVEALRVETELYRALGYQVALNFMPPNMDYRRFMKVLKRERDASAVRFAQLSQAVATVLAPVDAS